MPIVDFGTEEPSLVQKQSKISSAFSLSRWAKKTSKIDVKIDVAVAPVAAEQVAQVYGLRKEQADVATLRGRLEGLSKRLAAANADAKRKKEAYEAAAATASRLEQEKKSSTSTSR